MRTSAAVSDKTASAKAKSTEARLEELYAVYAPPPKTKPTASKKREYTTSRDKEALVEEIAQLKKNVHALQIDKRSLTITIRHMEEQSAKQDRQYEEMLINNVCRKRYCGVFIVQAMVAGPASSFDKMRKDDHLIRNLKKLVREQSSTIKKQNKELEDIKCSFRYTRVNELEIELKTYFRETMRLKRLMELSSESDAVKAYKAEVNRLLQEVDHLKGANQSQSDELTQLQAAKEEVNSSIQNLSNEKAELQRLLEIADPFKVLYEEQSALRQSLESRQTQLCAEIDALKNQVQEAQRYRDQVGNQDETIRQYEAKQVELAKEIDVLQAAVQRVRAELDKTTTEKQNIDDMFEKEIQAHDATRIEFMEQLSDLQQRMVNQARDFRAQADSMVTSLAKTRQQLSDVTQENFNIRAEIEKIKGQLVEAESEIMRIANDKQVLQDKLGSAISDKQALQTKLSLSIQERDLLSGEVANLQEQLVTKQEEVARMNARTVALEHQVTNMHPLPSRKSSIKTAQSSSDEVKGDKGKLTPGRSLLLVGSNNSVARLGHRSPRIGSSISSMRSNHVSQSDSSIHIPVPIIFTPDNDNDGAPRGDRQDRWVEPSRDDIMPSRDTFVNLIFPSNVDIEHEVSQKINVSSTNASTFAIKSQAVSQVLSSPHDERPAAAGALLAVEPPRKKLQHLEVQFARKALTLPNANGSMLAMKSIDLRPSHDSHEKLDNDLPVASSDSPFRLIGDSRKEEKQSFSLNVAESFVKSVSAQLQTLVSSDKSDKDESPLEVVVMSPMPLPSNAESPPQKDGVLTQAPIVNAEIGSVPQLPLVGVVLNSESSPQTDSVSQLPLVKHEMKLLPQTEEVPQLPLIGVVLNSESSLQTDSVPQLPILETELSEKQPQKAIIARRKSKDELSLLGDGSILEALAIAASQDQYTDTVALLSTMPISQQAVDEAVQRKLEGRRMSLEASLELPLIRIQNATPAGSKDFSSSSGGSIAASKSEIVVQDVSDGTVSGAKGVNAPLNTPNVASEPMITIESPEDVEKASIETTNQIITDAIDEVLAGPHSPKVANDFVMTELPPSAPADEGASMPFSERFIMSSLPPSPPTAEQLMPFSDRSDSRSISSVQFINGADAGNLPGLETKEFARELNASSPVPVTARETLDDDAEIETDRLPRNESMDSF